MLYFNKKYAHACIVGTYMNYTMKYLHIEITYRIGMLFQSISIHTKVE